MCTTYSISIQVRQGSVSEKYKTVKTIILPTKDMPLCGCWLFNLDFEGEEWKKVEAAHRAAGNIDKLLKMKEDTRRLNEVFSEAVMDVLCKLEPWYEQRLVIKKLA